MSRTSASRRWSPADVTALAFLLATNLTAITTELLMCALYPALATRLGAPLETVVLLGTPRALAQLGVLALGPLSDRVRREAILVGGLFLAAAAGWGAAVARSMGGMVLVQLGLGLNFAIATAIIPAIAGDHYAYAVRGRVLALIRLAMPLSLILFVPALVSLSARSGVGVAFALLGSAAGLLLVLGARRLPGLAGRSPARESAAPSAFRLGPAILLLLGLGLCLSLAPTAVFGFLSGWVGQTFGDPGRTVPLVLSSDGLGALAGVALSAAAIDRLTKQRAGALGLALAGVFALLLPQMRAHLLLTAVTVAGLAASLEIAFVSLAALLSEQAPASRGTVMGLWAASLAAGAAMAPLLARTLWLRGGMAAIGWAGGGLLLGLSVALAVVAVEPDGLGNK